MRAFIALDLDRQAKSYLSEIQNTIRQFTDTKGNWCSETNMHITLAFLGEITQEQANKLSKILSARLKNTKGLSLRLNHLGFFQNPDCATVWCSVDKNDNLNNIVWEIKRILKENNVKYDSKPFKAHITLGRKINLSNIKLSDFKIENIQIPVTGITLYKSTLTPKGPVYEALLL